MKNEKRLTAKERMEAKAKIAALRAEANALSKTLKDDETSVEEVIVEAPAEEVTEEVTPVEQTSVAVVTKNKKSFKDIILGFLACGFIVCVIALIAMFARNDQTTPPVVDNPNGDIGVNDPGNPGDSTDPENPGDSTDPENPGDSTDPVEPTFDMDAFATSVANIASTLTKDEGVAANADIFVEKIGEDKLVELVDKYGELPVQKALAEYLAFVPEIKMNQYINNNGLAYNPNAVDDYYMMLLEADNAYMEATGKNPNGALMSLEGYDIHKSNREAMKDLIIKSGDTALLAWYEAKTTGSDSMDQQKADTEAALAYKEEVKLELVNNVNGSVKLLELQLEQNVSGTDADTLTYTDVYKEFIINNYMYVVAN